MKHTLDDRSKLADIKLKATQQKEIDAKLELDKQRIEVDRNRLKLDQVNQLGKLLESVIIDETNKVKDFAFKPVFDEEEVKFIKKTLVKKIKER